MNPSRGMARVSLDEEIGFLDELRLRAVAAPALKALLAPGQNPITFEELSSRICAIASMVRDAGLRRNEVIAVIMPDGLELLSTILGTTSVAICAPLNPALRTSEAESYFRDLDVRALIVDPRHDLGVKEMANKLGVAVLDLERATDVSSSTTLAEYVRADDTALVLQTSATTAKARLVPLTHSNLRAMAVNTRRILQLSAEDRFLSVMPLFHLTGLLSSLATLLAGGSVISTSGFDSGKFLSWIEELHPTWYTASPALHNAILPLFAERPDVLNRFPLRFVRSIGAPLQQSLLAELERVLHVPVLEGYGMTEAGMVASNTPQKRRAGSVGQSAGVEVAVMGDSETFLPTGCEGEIAVRGPAVIRGYRDNAEADESAFRGAWFLTGDVGYVDEEGFLFVTGRIKDIINRGGEKVRPGEVDEVLSTHPMVSETAAFGVPHPTLGEDVAAAAVLIPGASVTEAELRRFVADRLADFKIPRRIIFMDSIPRGPTGKALRTKLAEQFLQGEAALRANQGDTLTPIEKKLEIIWKRILRIDEIGIRDDFFAAGGDSLGLTLLMAEIEFEFEVDGTLLEGSEFFSSPTIETLAGVIQGRTPASMNGTRLPFVALQPMGSRIPVFCIPGADENPYYFRDLAKDLGQDQPFYVLRDLRPEVERGVYSIEEHAAYYCRAVRSVRKHGPYILAGHCYGGILAFETARQLVSMGEEMSLLALFEVPTPGYPKIVRHWRSYFVQSKLMLSGLVRGEDRMTWADLRSHARVLKGLVKRKSEKSEGRDSIGSAPAE